MEQENDIFSPSTTLKISNSSALGSDARVICRVCQRQFSQYTCPRCNSRYCSLECYKRHSVRCTESFMRENVMEELQHIQPEDETKRKMWDILKRFHLEEEKEFGHLEDIDDGDGGSGEEGDSTVGEELIDKIMSGGCIELEDLSGDEMTRFRKSIASGVLGKLIEPWTPWWTKPSAKSFSLSQDGSQLIKHIQKEQENSESIDSPESSEIINDIPPGPESALPPLRLLTEAEPSPLLVVHLIDILYSYCFTLRLYNGDWQSDSFGAATVALTISKVLSGEGKPETVGQALASCLEETCSSTYKHAGGFNFAIGLVSDVICLLSLGRDALVCAICDLRRIVQAGQQMAGSEKMSKKERGCNIQKLKAVERKLYFLMCWLHEQPETTWSSFGGVIQAEKVVLLEIHNSGSAHKDDRNGAPKPKLLLEEL